jgi:hypothetical protein
MKVFASLVFLLFISATCHRSGGKATGSKQGSNPACYKAQLEIKGICMNYVIKVLEGDLNALAVEKEWIDESDGKRHNNVFALGSRCTFPDLQEGETFYFTLSQKEDTQCNVCMAYRPVPVTKNNIVVSKTPCP